MDSLTIVTLKIKPLWLMFTLMVFSLLCWLGFWQLDRAEYKTQRLARIAELNQQAALTMEDVINLQVSGDEINDLPVTLVVEFDDEKVFLLDNQPHQRQLGYRVFQVAYWQQQALLVNLGWVAGNVDRNLLPDIRAIDDRHRITGYVRIPEVGVQLKAQQFSSLSWPLRVQQIELPLFETVIAQPLFDFVIYLAEEEPLGFEKNWQPIVMPPEKHHGYAVQWFALATAWLMLMASMVVRQSITKESSNTL